MRIKARGHHALRCYTAHLPEGGTMTVDADATVERVLDQLKVPAVQRATLLIFVNGRPARPDQALQEMDDLVFFSPIEGG
jgi:sulfur carrier protein ThiS